MAEITISVDTVISSGVLRVHVLKKVDHTKLLSGPFKTIGVKSAGTRPPVVPKNKGRCPVPGLICECDFATGEGEQKWPGRRGCEFSR